MITPLDNQPWSSEVVTGNAQFIEVDSTIYVVSQVRADNTFAVFKSEPAPPEPGPGSVFDIKATYTFPNPNSSFDPVVAYDGTTGTIYIVGTQDNEEYTDVLLFSFSISTNTLSTPTKLVTASYVRDSYDICTLASTQFIAIVFTNPQEIWTTPTIAEVTSINISDNTLTVVAPNDFLNGQNITFSGLQNAQFMNGVTAIDIVATANGFTAAYVAPNYTQVGYESGFAAWIPGHSLVGFEINGTSLVSVTVLDSSPLRSGNTFGAVSVYSPDESTIEVYYESHPKQVTFQDQTFSVNLATRTSGTWSLPSTVLKTFSGRYADSRLTVIAQGDTRTLLQQYFSQLVHQNTLVGNLLLGYYDGVTKWEFQIQPGSPITSYIQGTLSVSETQGTFVSYLAEPVGIQGTSWPLRIAALDVTTFNLLDVPGFYNTLNFTWLRGAKAILDDKTEWGVIGEQVLGEGDATFGARYVSGFDSPPGVVLVPDTHPPGTPSSTTVLRGTPFLFDASGTNDANFDPLTFIWTFTPANSYVTLTPVTSAANTKANLLVSRAIGGAAQSFTVGVVATTPAHPAMEIVNIGIENNVLTIGTNALVNLVTTESVFLYNIGTAAFLNDLMVTVTGVSGSNFTVDFTHTDYASTVDTGSAIASPQFDWCSVTVPSNPSPTITFPQNPISAARNSLVTIIPTYGVADLDDAITYEWTQVSGTPVTVLGGTTSPTLQIETNGVLIQGEALVWGLTVNDGVNSPVTSTVTVNVAAYPFQIQDTLRLSRSLWGPNATISQRNTVQSWSSLDVSAIYTNFQNVKRISVLDGSDRYLLISSASVCVYGGINPNMILSRRLLVPTTSQGSPPTWVQNLIVDAVHTEDDTTLVLDSAGNLYRYSTAPLINTDNPDTIIRLSAITSMSFNRLFLTSSFNNVRILVLTGVDGCLLLQIQNTDMAVEGSLELTVGSGAIYGVDNVQFVRTSNVESLNSGKILLGTIVSLTADIQSISILDNTVVVEAENFFSEEQVVTFQDLTQATFLNGVIAPVVSATPTQFIVSYEHGDYSVTPEGTGAVAVAGGKTYETLIDLSHGQIIGTFDASNLQNQYVTTGEILFEGNDTYAGLPVAPVLNPIVNNGSIGSGIVSLTISWSANRPDLIQYYDLEISLDGVNWSPSTINSGYIESITLPEPVGQYFYFRVRAISVDGISPYSNIQTVSTGGSLSSPPLSTTGFAIEFGTGFGTT